MTLDICSLCHARNSAPDVSRAGRMTLRPFAALTNSVAAAMWIANAIVHWRPIYGWLAVVWTVLAMFWWAMFIGARS